MKALIVGDIHLADRPPASRRDGYTGQVLDKLYHTIEVAREERVDVVVWAGDVFHLKAPSRTSHSLVRQVVRIGKAYRVPWLIVPGNHDMQHDRLESLFDQPIGVVYESGAEVCVGDAGGVFGIPWLRSWPLQLEKYLEGWAESEAELLVTHAPIVPPGESRPFEVIDAAEWARAMGRPGAVYYGHMHEPDGEFEAGGAWFCNVGALSRGALIESSLVREPSVALYEDGRFRRIVVPHLPAQEVFRLTEAKERDARREEMEGFVESIGSTVLEWVTVEGVLEDLRQRGVRPEVLEEVRSCFEVVDG